MTEKTTTTDRILELAREMHDMAEAIEPVTGDGYGHLTIDDDKYRTKIGLEMAASLLEKLLPDNHWWDGY